MSETNKSEGFSVGEFFKNIWKTPGYVTVRLTKDGKAIDLFDCNLGPENPYYIELDSISSVLDLVIIVYQLSGKKWITTEAIAKFLDIVSQHKKITIGDK
jgi:hypothetical protein